MLFLVLVAELAMHGLVFLSSLSIAFPGNPELLVAHQGIVTVLACSPNGQLLASGAQDGTVRLWDIAARKIRAVFPGHGRMVTALAFSPDGKSLATAGYDRGYTCETP